MPGTSACGSTSTAVARPTSTSPGFDRPAHRVPRPLLGDRHSADLCEPAALAIRGPSGHRFHGGCVRGGDAHMAHRHSLRYVARNGAGGRTGPGLCPGRLPPPHRLATETTSRGDIDDATLAAFRVAASADRSHPCRPLLHSLL